MDHYILIISGIIKITLLDMVLSGDNIGIIALATKDLPLKLAKKASFIGVIFAIVLRIIFSCFITYILMIEGLPIKLVGGIVLIIITFDFIKPKNNNTKLKQKSVHGFWRAIYSIVLADLTMSIDNVLAIAGSANGNIFLIVFGLLINIPIIFLGSVYVANIMKKHPFVIYIGGAILAHTAFDMFLHDKLMLQIIPEFFVLYIPYAAAIIITAYGYYVTSSNRHKLKKIA
ncbi:TerC family protein [Clostridium pasteurianum]|uniref:Integral membrane protein, YjbE family n=1 Tax=Clostridium pasteurianum BC1 TaxID=86416 RepID=R4K689_CLOPA|nr:TerC family protein [Clostridium pasteurianum]AGK98053.1 integral membrane protein, YjbE family [Clostridium pasteurianum BC1]